jgi:acyl carrier protein
MSKEELLESLQEAMDLATDVEYTKKLDEYDEWDSLAMLNVLGFFYDHDINLEVEDLESCYTAEDIAKKAGIV